MRRVTLTTLTMIAALLWAAPASASFGLSNFDVTFSNELGGAEARAGAHPDELTVSFDVNTKETEKGGVAVEEALKDLELKQIPGLAGNPTAVPPCATADFLNAITSSGGFKIPDCPDSAAVGIVKVDLIAKEQPSGSIAASVFNLEPPPGLAAKLGFWVGGVPVTIDLGVSETPPYNIVGGPTYTSQVLEVAGSEFTIWGVPADPVHNPLRGRCLEADGASSGSCPAGVSAKPFLTMPRACQGPLATAWRADSWQQPGAFVHGSSLTHDAAGNPRGMGGCGGLAFAPQVSATPTSRQAESSTGLEFSVDVDDAGLANPDGVAAADIAGITTVLPAGVTANPSAAEGLGTCSRAQFSRERLDVPAGQGCPDAAKLGSIEASTPLLEGRTLRGSIYLAAQDDPATADPGAENPFDSLFALYLTVRDRELGVFVKLAGSVEPDPRSGQLVATFDRDLPPFPLSEVRVRFRSGPRAPLVTPPVCGTYTTETYLTPSSGQAPIASPSSFTIDSGPGGGACPSGGVAPFAPGFEAGTLSNTAGAFSPFVMRITRADGSQDLTRFSAVLPPGVSGKIAGVPQCPDAALAAAAAKAGRAELAASSCLAASQIGRVLAGAGVGNALTYVPGSLYLAGPYKGAPLSVAAVVPAVAGPFDVGTVVTRVGLRLNPSTAQVEVDGASSDPIPHILEGIPLKLRELRVLPDRSDFTLNATSCTPSGTEARLFGSSADPFSSADDIAVSRDARYQAASCASLAFKPKLRLALTGKMRRGDNPALRAELTPRPGDANLEGAVVTLPRSQFIDNAHITGPCSRGQFAQGACPLRSVLGSARAFTPLLDEPLEGKAYFVANGGVRHLPDVVVALRGQFDFNLVIATLSNDSGRVRTKVLNAPDAPVSRFVLNLVGGNKGLLQNSEYLCRKQQRVALKLTGQNGRVHKTQPVIQTSCGKSKKKKPRSARARP